MNWIQDFANFAKKLLTVEKQVKINAEEIKELRRDLKTLTGFIQKVTYVVKHNEEKSKDQQEILTQSLKIQLLELERSLFDREALLKNGRKCVASDKGG